MKKRQVTITIEDKMIVRNVWNPTTQEVDVAEYSLVDALQGKVKHAYTTEVLNEIANQIFNESVKIVEDKDAIH